MFRGDVLHLLLWGCLLCHLHGSLVSGEMFGYWNLNSGGTPNANGKCFPGTPGVMSIGAGLSQPSSNPGSRSYGNGVRNVGDDSAYATISGFNMLSAEFSLTFWVDFDKNDDSFWIFDRSNSISAGLCKGSSTSPLIVRTTLTGTEYELNLGTVANDWYFVAVVYDGSSLRGWKLRDSDSWSSTPTDEITSLDGFNFDEDESTLWEWMGKPSGVGCNGGKAFEGTVDEIKIFDSSLSLSELEDIFLLPNDNIGPSNVLVNSLDPSVETYQVDLGESLVLTATAGAGPSGNSLSASWTLCDCSSTLDGSTTLSPTFTSLDLGTIELDICIRQDQLTQRLSTRVDVVAPLPVISTQPEANPELFEGEDLLLSVDTEIPAGRADLLSFQWQENIMADNSTNGTRMAGRWWRDDQAPHYGLSRRGNVTEMWTNIPGETTRFLNIPNLTTADDGREFRCAVTIQSTVISNASRLVVLNGTDPNGGDGGGGGIIQGSSKGSASSLGAVGGSMGALALLLCCCCCFIIALLCCAIVSLLCFIAVGYKTLSPTNELKKLTKPDFRAITYGTYLESNGLSTEERENCQHLERILVEYADSVPHQLMSCANTSELDKLCTSLVYVYDANGLAYDVIARQIRMEVGQATDEGTMFRANSAATKMFSKYSRVVGMRFLWESFAVLIHKMNESCIADGDAMENPMDESSGAFTFEMLSTMEVNPAMSNISEDLGETLINTMQLNLVAQRILKIILSRKNDIPADIVCILRDVSEEMSARSDLSTIAVYRALGGFFFLRFVCPALLSPPNGGLTNLEVLHVTAQRNTILLGKILQNLANNTLPGAKEEYMAPLDSFVTENVPRLEKFYSDLACSSKTPSNRVSDEPEVRWNALSQLMGLLPSIIPSLKARRSGDEPGEMGDAIADLEALINA